MVDYGDIHPRKGSSLLNRHTAYCMVTEEGISSIRKNFGSLRVQCMAPYCYGKWPIMDSRSAPFYGAGRW